MDATVAPELLLLLHLVDISEGRQVVVNLLLLSELDRELAALLGTVDLRVRLRLKRNRKLELLLGHLLLLGQFKTMNGVIGCDLVLQHPEVLKRVVVVLIVRLDLLVHIALRLMKVGCRVVFDKTLLLLVFNALDTSGSQFLHLSDVVLLVAQLLLQFLLGEVLD